VDACPTGALKFGEESEFGDLIATAEPLDPKINLKTRAFYHNLPNKHFVAGTVYDPKALEVVIGAACTLTGEGETYNLETNHWGDFWFEDLKPGVYSLTVQANGKSKTIADINAEKDVGLGDIPLE
jgi:hypothetical protein